MYRYTEEYHTDSMAAIVREALLAIELDVFAD